MTAVILLLCTWCAYAELEHDKYVDIQKDFILYPPLNATGDVDLPEGFDWNQPFNGTEGLQIVGGNVLTSPLPYFALTMRESNGQFFRYPCGASLIGAKWMLTAAHCILDQIAGIVIDRRSQLTHVYLGAVAPWDGNRGYPHSLIKIVRYILHPDRDHSSKPYDVALMELETEVDTSLYQPVVLATANYDQVNLFPGRNLDVYGFGRTTWDGASSRELRGAGVAYTNNTSCASAYRSLDIDITRDMLCAGGDGATDACGGDSGGPLVLNGNPTVQVGVVSFGHRCAVEGYPGVYARVSMFTDWIQSYVRDATFMNR